MSELFGPTYANAYDVLYQDKDYADECDLIEHILRTYGDFAVRSVLDLGCGTGNHAIPLAQRGYEVVGVDRSTDMLARARQKAAGQPGAGGILLHQGDVRTIDLRRRCDAALMMFAVLGYQHENADVLAALRTARRHLRPGGLFVFDVWYGPAVLHQRPSDRVRVIPTPEGQILRAASGSLDVRHHVCTVSYHIWRLQGERLAAEMKESHRMRYFFPLELEFFLESAGFASLRLGAFPALDRDPDETTWNVLAVAKAV